MTAHTASATTELSLPEPNQLNRFTDWDLDFRQIESGPMDTRIAVRSGKMLALLDIQMSRSVHQVGVAPPGMMTFGIPQNRRLSEWRGESVAIPSLLSFGYGDEFQGVTDAGFRGITFAVAAQQLEDVANCLGIAIDHSLQRALAFPVRRDPGRLLQISRRARRFLAASDALPDRSEEECIITELLIAATDCEKHDDRSSSASRSRAVSMALEFMDLRAEENTPIGTICTETGVSWRTLDRAFHERFGIGPKAYHSRLRLSRVRSELLEVGADCLVSDVANKWGFWHMGQFAKDYCQLFGELPSETRDSLHQDA
jgi:AraC family transcriptional regulator, ethanolamine operon transcriptional activator